MKVIFINRFFHPDLSATSQMLSDQAFALTRSGRNVVVIASRQDYQNKNVRLRHREEMNGVTVYRVWASNFGRGHLLGRCVDYVTFLLSSSWLLLWIVQRRDIVIAKTDPPLLSIFIYPICAVRGAKLINWLQDLFPEVATKCGIGSSPFARFPFRVMRYLRDWSLRGARANIVLGARMARRVRKLGVESARIIPIPNWADGTEIYPVPRQKNALRREWGLDNQFVVAHSGNLGRAHEYEVFLDAARQLECRDTEHEYASEVPIRWVFIGGGANFAKLQKRVNALGLQSIDFKPYQPKERLAESLSCADVHLVTLRAELEGLIVPSKVYGCLAAGRPVVFVGDVDGEIARLLKRHMSGIAISNGGGSDEKLARSLKQLTEDPELTVQMGRNARLAFEREYDVSHAIQRWQDLIATVEAQ